MRCEDCRWCVPRKIVGSMVEWECLKADELTNEELWDADKCSKAEAIPIDDED